MVSLIERVKSIPHLDNNSCDDRDNVVYSKNGVFIPKWINFVSKFIGINIFLKNYRK